MAQAKLVGKKGTVYKFQQKKITQKKAAEIATANDLIQEMLLEKKVGQMTVEGQSLEQIGDMLGIPTSRAFEITKNLIAKWSGPLSFTANEVREIAVKRLDLMLSLTAQMAVPHPIISKETGLPILGDDGKPIMTPPDLNAIKIMLDIEDRRAKLLGIDAADKLKEKALDTLTRRYIGGEPDGL